VSSNSCLKNTCCKQPALCCSQMCLKCKQKQVEYWAWFHTSLLWHKYFRNKIEMSGKYDEVPSYQLFTVFLRTYWYGRHLTFFWLSSGMLWRPDDGDNKYFWNDDQFLPGCKAQRPIRQSPSYLPSWEPEISPSSDLTFLDLKLWRMTSVYFPCQTTLTH
jgi:hypothetical protein